MIFGVILMTVLLPLQIQVHDHQRHRVNQFFTVGAFVDCAKILGLPKFRLRDSNGNPYLSDKVIKQESMALVHEGAGIALSGEVGKRKAYIHSYVSR